MRRSHWPEPCSVARWLANGAAAMPEAQLLERESSFPAFSTFRLHGLALPTVCLSAWHRLQFDKENEAKSAGASPKTRPGLGLAWEGDPNNRRVPAFISFSRATWAGIG